MVSSNARFIPGKELGRQLAEVLEPALRVSFPGMPIALALLGPGSDVLGLDTARSMDHDWGPRVSLLVPESEVETVQQRFDENLHTFLPESIAGFPTRFSLHPDGTALIDPAGSQHRVAITCVEELLRSTLMIDSLEELTDATWFSTSMQSLLELTSGDVFVDDSGDLTCIREALAIYPDHIWRYQLSALWMRISQVQPFVGRCFENGDAIGGAGIAFGIIRDLMRIGILQSRKYAPYAKWLGTAFSRTELSRFAMPHLQRALDRASNYQVLEQSLNRAGVELIKQLNDLELVLPFDPEPQQFHSRPYLILPAEEIAHALYASLANTAGAHWPPFVGGIDFVSDSTDAHKNPEFRRALQSIFAEHKEGPPD